MKSHPIAAFIEENYYTNQIASLLAGDRYNIERLTLEEFLRLKATADGREVLKEAIFFIPLENNHAVQAIADIDLDHKFPVVGYVESKHAHEVTPPTGTAILSHGDAIEHAHILQTLDKAKKLASSQQSIATNRDGSWLSLSGVS